MQAGILKNIKYPTGGITNFTYEPHDYYDSINPYYKVIGNVKKEAWKGPVDQPLPGIGNFQETLNFTEETLATVDFYFEYLLSGTIDTYGVDMTIEDSNGNTLIQFNADSQGSNTQISTTQINFPAGQYVIKIDNLNRENHILGIIVNYEQFATDTAKIGGGLRIGEIETIDSGQAVKKSVYEYSDNGISHGRLIRKARYWMRWLQVYFDSHNHYTLVAQPILTRTSSATIANGISTEGNFVGYDLVKVSGVDTLGTKLGETKSYFKNIYSSNLEYYGYDVIPGIPEMGFTENGQLILEETFNSSGTRIHKKIINYGVKIELDATPGNGGNPSNYIQGLKTYSERPISNLTQNPPYEIYYIPSEWRYPINEINTTYDLSGNNSVTTFTDYEYGSTSHKNITKTTTKNSKGETIVSNMEYPSDYPSGTGMSTSTFDAMVADNMINPIIKQTNTLNGELLSTQITKYKDWDIDGDNVTNDPDDILLPELIKSAKGIITASNPLQDKIEFVKYDEQGRVLEVKQADGMPISYVWGYNNEYPIAKIENATYSQVSSQVSNLQSKSNLDNDNCLDSESCDEKNLRTALVNLRVSLPDAMVSTYTYDPLIGVTSMTDPKGYTVYYVYDELNRLKQVKNAKGDIVSQNEYHYKGQ